MEPSLFLALNLHFSYTFYVVELVCHLCCHSEMTLLLFFFLWWWITQTSSFADMWAIGAILAELFTLTPIFPGERYLKSPMFSHLCHLLVDFCAFTYLINFINILVSKIALLLLRVYIIYLRPSSTLDVADIDIW